MSTANNTSTAKVHWTYWLHLAIGLGFMFLFPQLSPIEPITEVGCMSWVPLSVWCIYGVRLTRSGPACLA